MNSKYYILLVLFIIAFLASIMLAFSPKEDTCALDTNCSAVQLSNQATTLGIKNCHYGVVIFFFMSILIFMQIKKPSKRKKFIIHSGVIIGSLVSFYFLYLQFFVLNAICIYCLTVDFSMLLSLIITALYWKK